MALITESIEIARSPADVFAYLDDLARHIEWQLALEEVTVETEGPTRVGTRVRARRRVPGGSQEYHYEITEHDPPRRSSFRGIDGLVRPVGVVTVAELDPGRSRVTIELELEGHRSGKLLAPLARREARKTVPLDQQRLKDRLESGADAAARP